MPRVGPGSGGSKGLVPPDPVPHNAPSLRSVSPKGVAMPRARKVRLSNPGFQTKGMFGGRAMKSPEDYETGQAVQGLGKAASPYYAEKFAKSGQQLRYDTATNTYR